MPINQQRLSVKLQAILDKDLDEIIAKQTYLPFMGNTYTKAELQTWLDKRSDLLQGVLDGNYSDNQIAAAVNSNYNTLSTEGKVIADSIIAREEYDLEGVSESDYEKLVFIILFVFVSDP